MQVLSTTVGATAIPQVPIITIDGPAASGKGSIARKLASKLKFDYLDSGLVYRALAYLIIRHNLEPQLELLNNHIADDLDEEAIIAPIVELIHHNMHLHLIMGKNNVTTVILNGEEITNELREEHLGMIASTVAKSGLIRLKLLDFQREFANPYDESGQPKPNLLGLVTDGRDMGSVVFPEAKLKIFLTAKPEVRAKRRYLELQSSGKPAKMEPILRDILLRDEQDSMRVAAPLKYDATYKFLDNSDLTIDETLTYIVDCFNQSNEVHK